MQVKNLVSPSAPWRSLERRNGESQATGGTTMTPAEQLNKVKELVEAFELSSLRPMLRACEKLASDDDALDVAVLGQFKSGKSSLLNTLLGETVFPVGVVPVTTVITRAVVGLQHQLRVTYENGSTETAPLDRIIDYVTESGNPRNYRHVAQVDVLTPAMARWPGLRLVDTPGLGSVLAHNTETTRAWMPNVAVALVAVSADRPLSDEDRALLAEARQLAPRVVVILTKVDILTESERADVLAFLNRELGQGLHQPLPLLPFSTRSAPEHWRQQLAEQVLLPVGDNVAEERRYALELKSNALVRACAGYLSLGLQAAKRAAADRDRLRAAVLTESVSANILHDELRLAEQHMKQVVRAAFENALFAQRGAISKRLTESLAVAVAAWRGNLARQARLYESWMADNLRAELMPLSEQAQTVAAELVDQAAARFSRIIEAARDRLSRNITEAVGVQLSPAAWDLKRPQVTALPIALSQTFMIDWDLLWWVLPMWLVGGLFRRHVLGRVSWEVEKNLTRLLSDWTEAVTRAVANMGCQAADWVDAELTTLDQLLGHQPAELARFRQALQKLGEIP